MTAIQGSPRWLRLVAAIAAVAFGLTLLGLRGSIAAAGPTAEASKAARVGIDRFAFHPATLRIAKGTSVAFSNSSGVTHTATRAGSFDTGKIRPGKSALVRFAQKGTIAYHCTIHPFMHGKIVVE